MNSPTGLVFSGWSENEKLPAQKAGGLYKTCFQNCAAVL
jgi:hypothetical protein